MSIRDSIFVDVSNLNILYKSRDKFAVALNFSSGLDRLCVLSGVSPCIDVYLCVKPRPAGDGDMIIKELSLISFPFTCNKEEIDSIIKFFKGMRGVSNIYICNWVHNFIEVARVPTFTSVIFFADYVLRMDVKDKLLEAASFYLDAADFSSKNDEDPSFYGDVGLIDVNSIRAQYPEFSKVSKQQLVALAPLIACYKTTMKIDASQLLLEEESNSKDTENARDTKLPEQEDTDNIAENVKPSGVNDFEVSDSNVSGQHTSVATAEVTATSDNIAPKVRGKTPAIFKILGVAACFCAFIAGGLLGAFATELQPPMTESELLQSEAELASLQQLAFSYSSAHDKVSDLVGYLDYIGNSGVGQTLLGFESVPEGVNFSFSVKEKKDKETLISYLGQKYNVLSSSDLGASSADGGTTYRFSVVLSN